MQTPHQLRHQVAEAGPASRSQVPCVKVITNEHIYKYKIKFVRFVGSFPKESTTVHGLWAEGTGGQPNNVNTMETMKREWGFGIMNSQ